MQSRQLFEALTYSFDEGRNVLIDDIQVNEPHGDLMCDMFLLLFLLSYSAAFNGQSTILGVVTDIMRANDYKGHRQWQARNKQARQQWHNAIQVSNKHLKCVID